MKVSELQTAFMTELSGLLKGWQFVKRHHGFKQNHGDVVWHFHVACINHKADFDAVGDAAVEIQNRRSRVCIVSATLSNIEGSGQTRFAVTSLQDVKDAAGGLVRQLSKVGLPFLKRYSDPVEILRVLKHDPTTARLISPLVHAHAEQIAALEAYLSAKSPNPGVQPTPEDGRG
jgi:hypothetical protein